MTQRNRRFVPLVMLILAWLFPSECLAQWRCELKNVVATGNNIQWILQFSEPVNQPRDVSAEIRMRRPGRYQDLFRKEVTLSLDGPRWYSLPLNLLPGVYEYEVEIYDSFLKESQLILSDGVFLVNASAEIRVSDIFFSLTNDPAEAFGEPLLSPNLPPSTDTLYYFAEIQSNQNRSVRTEAYFYENTNQSVARAGNITLYASLQESIRNIGLQKEVKALISGKLFVKNLAEGAYLLDITIVSGEMEPIQETARFVIGSSMRQWIFANLDDAIRMMKYILPMKTIDELLDSPTEEARKIEFKEAWEDLYREDAEIEMDLYYLRIFEANKRFGEQGGWQSDQGKVFVLYGAPSEEEVFEAKTGKKYLRWAYPKWSLLFLFEARNQSYYLVE